VIETRLGLDRIEHTSKVMVGFLPNIRLKAMGPTGEHVRNGRRR
jgi:hypothetical protein